MIFDIQLFKADQVDFGHDNNEGFILEKRLDVVEQGDLLRNGVATGFRNIDEEENAGLQVGEGGDGLHFNGVAFLEGVVENSGGVDDLPPGIKRSYLT